MCAWVIISLKRVIDNKACLAGCTEVLAAWDLGTGTSLSGEELKRETHSSLCSTWAHCWHLSCWDAIPGVEMGMVIYGLLVIGSSLLYCVPLVLSRGRWQLNEGMSFGEEFHTGPIQAERSQESVLRSADVRSGRSRKKVGGQTV